MYGIRITFQKKISNFGDCNKPYRDIMRSYLLTAAIACITVSSLCLNSCKKEDENEISMDALSKGVVVVTDADGNEYEAVDLGLVSGNLWAKCNLGAATPEQPGHFFAWADTVVRTTFSHENYAWYDNESGEDLTKYCSNKDYGYHGFTDALKTMEDSDDPSKVLLGDAWWTPSKDDYDELRRWCKSKWCKLNGVGGFLLTSTRKGYEECSIFIPLSGKMDFEERRFNTEYGFYWTNTLDEFNPTDANIIRLRHAGDNDVLEGNLTHERYAGLNIRPITNKY